VPPLEATVKVTGTVLVVPLPLTVTVPVNVPAARPVTTGETASVAGVVPVEGETLSHDALPALAVKVLLGDAATETDWEAGDVPPAVAENESEPGFTDKVGVPLRARVTGTLMVRPLPVRTTVPVKVPAARPVMVDETVMVAGVVPVEDETLSHDAPLTLAVNVVLGLAVSESVFDAGEAAPAGAENDNEVGVTARVLGAETVNVTGTLTERSSPYLMLTVPL
jgi:hypothetical protein